MPSIETILKNKYSAEDWYDVYQYLFPGCKFYKEPQSIPVTEPAVSQALQVGNVELSGEKLLFFDVEVNESVSLERNRTTLNRVLAKLLNNCQYDAAIGIFHSQANAVYRFTFVKRSVHFNDSNEVVSEWTNPKRYTYIFGQNKPCGTALQRFERLHNLSSVTLADVEEAFSVEALTKEFYKELFNWYEWASSDETGIFYPDLKTAATPRMALQEHLIRLITRLIFVWFIKQKGLVPDELFKVDEIKKHLKEFDCDSTTQHNYYRCYLQNLFFATLNREIEERAFANDGRAAINDHGVSALYRYADEFSCGREEIKEMFSRIPYLNGGLFECLDSKDETVNAKAVYRDGFSRKKSVAAKLPNCLFFSRDKGLIPLLEKYNFTIEENSCSDQTVALDPELLGKVFENLLGAYNPETQNTARNDSGSFYTPREIVDYMIDESLLAYLRTNLPDKTVSELGIDRKRSHSPKGEVPSLLEELFRNEELPEGLADNAEACSEIAGCLRRVKILDPACGSGAFPVGALKRIMELLRRLSKDTMTAQDIYQTKLELIENCLYGVDIQTIAVQIAKLRFFISLICEQTPQLNDRKNNYGIKPLPNLETRFVAADTLVNLQKGKELFFDEELKKIQAERHEISQKLICPKNRSAKKILQMREKELAHLAAERLAQTASHPDESKIKALKDEIAELEKQRLRVEKPDCREAEPSRQQFFAFDGIQQEPQKHTYDANAEKRKVFDKRIKELKKKISREEKNDDNVDEVRKIARKLSSWVSSDLNGTADFFDPEWMFAINEGFDIVVGNPPYIQLQENQGKLADHYQPEGFNTFQRKGDIYCLFYERGCQLLKNNGHLCFITSNKWMRAEYGKALRNFLVDKTKPELLIDFAGQKIFEAATVDTNILLFAKSGKSDKNKGQTTACIAQPGCRNNLSIKMRQKA